jgi:hypothetical protein
MNTNENSVEEKIAIISSSPPELRHNVVFVMCQNQLLRALNDCSHLEGDEVWKSLPPEERDESYIGLSTVAKQEIIKSIIANISEVKSILWAAVLSANPGQRNNSTSEG